MDDDSGNLFVIDKSGGSGSLSSKILYDFKEDPDLADRSDAVEEPQPQQIRHKRPLAGKRYHEVHHLSDFKPGCLSKELRKALNLARHELPIHIYRMRSLGYPPGWLRKARVGDGLVMFDSVYALAENTDVSYNREALVSYPGFNTRIEFPFVDECEVLKCPPMQSHHMLDNFYAALSRSAGSRAGTNNRTGKLSSAELEKLWAERERILAEIRQLDSRVSKNDANAEIDDSKNQIPPQKSVEASTKSNPSTIVSEPDSAFEASEVVVISGVESGTPTPNVTLDSEQSSTTASDSTSNSRRPEIDAFSVGVQPFRPFQNLPGTQGGYKRVLETLKNSRTVISATTSSSNSEPPNKPNASSESLSERNSRKERSYHPYSR